MQHRACVALPHIGEVRLSELGRAHVIKARDILAKNCPPGTTPKYGQVRQLRLPSALVPILRAWREQCPPTARGLVCPIWDRGRWHMSMSTGKTHGLPKLLKAANCQQVSGCWHMLRHTFASHYMMAGGSLLALSKILGHSNMVMTMV